MYKYIYIQYIYIYYISYICIHLYIYLLGRKSRAVYWMKKVKLGKLELCLSIS